MNKALIEALLDWPQGYIFTSDLHILIGGSKNSIQAIIKRAVADGYLQRLKRDLYVISSRIKQSPLDSFVVASLIYGPSYISFESALAAHGWIPEAVYTISSAAVKKSKTFSTSLGQFSFEKIPSEIFAWGVEHVKSDGGYYFVADPWKALADMIYTRKKQWSDVAALMSDMRIEEMELAHSDHALLDWLSRSYPHQQTQRVLTQLKLSMGK